MGDKDGNVADEADAARVGCLLERRPLVEEEELDVAVVLDAVGQLTAPALPRASGRRQAMSGSQVFQTAPACASFSAINSAKSSSQSRLVVAEGLEPAGKVSCRAVPVPSGRSPDLNRASNERRSRSDLNWMTGPKSTRSSGKAGTCRTSSTVSRPASTRASGLISKGLPAKDEKD